MYKDFYYPIFIPCSRYYHKDVLFYHEGSIPQRLSESDRKGHFLLVESLFALLPAPLYLSTSFFFFFSLTLETRAPRDVIVSVPDNAFYPQPSTRAPLAHDSPKAVAFDNHDVAAR